MTRLAVSLGLLLLFCGEAAAQVCDIKESYNDCIRKLNTRASGGAADAELAKANTGTQSGDVDAATDDFNPRFQAAVDAQGLDSDDDGAGITLAWNDLLQKVLRGRFDENGTATHAGQHHKLVVKLEEAQLFEPLENGIADAAVSDPLQKSLDDFDDVSVAFRFSLNSVRLGRDLQAHTEYISAIQSVSMEALDPDRELRAQIGDQEDQILQQMFELFDDFEADVRLDTTVGDARARALLAATEKAYAAQIDYAVSLDAHLRRNGLFDLVKLVNNQPQIVLSVDARQRDDLVGPDETALKFVYEFGGVNVNAYNRYREGVECAQGNIRLTHVAAVDDDMEVACLTRFIGANSTAIDEGNRFAASLEYADKEHYVFSGSGVNLDLPSHSSLVAKLTYGRYLRLGRDTGGVGRSRIDVSASYEDVNDDPTRQNRAIAKAVFAQEVSDGLFLEIGFAWANKPEFRGEVDHEVSAKAGISYKLARSEQ